MRVAEQISCVSVEWMCAPPILLSKIGVLSQRYARDSMLDESFAKEVEREREKIEE